MMGLQLILHNGIVLSMIDSLIAAQQCCPLNCAAAYVHEIERRVVLLFRLVFSGKALRTFLAVILINIYLYEYRMVVEF